MFKKAIITFLVFSFLFVCLSKADVQDVSFRFCDDVENEIFKSGKKTFFVNPGQEKEFCVYFTNNSEKSVKLIYGFSKAEMREQGMIVCDADKGSQNTFSKYFTGEKPREFTLNKNASKTIKEKIFLPLGMSGVQYGCFAYSLGEYQGTGLGGMFNLVVNKVFPIILFVGSGDQIKNDVLFLNTTGGAYTTNKKIKATLDEENNLKLSFLVRNQGNISQDIIITGKIYNILGFEKNFSSSNNNVVPGQEKEITVDVGIIPFYKGIFTVKVNGTYEPIFNFDISGLSEDIKKGGTMNEIGKIYLFSRVRIVIYVVLILFLIKLFTSRKKNNNISTTN